MNPIHKLRSFLCNTFGNTTIPLVTITPFVEGNVWEYLIFIASLKKDISNTLLTQALLLSIRGSLELNHNPNRRENSSTIVHQWTKQLFGMW